MNVRATQTGLTFPLSADIYNHRKQERRGKKCPNFCLKTPQNNTNSAT